MKHSIPETLPVLDWNLGMARVNGDAAFARELLAMLLESLPQAQANLEQHFESQAWDKLQAEAHKLRGASSYCATPRLTEAAKNLEASLHDQEVPEADYFALLKEIQAVLDSQKDA